MRSKFAGSAKPGNPAVDRCGAAGSEQRTSNSRAMAGLRSRALGPGARSWLTGVAGPCSRKRGPHIARTPQWSAGRRLVPSPERGDAFAKRPTGRFRQPPIGGLAHPRVFRRSAPLEGAGNCKLREGLPGADQRIRAMNHAFFPPLKEEGPARHAPGVGSRHNWNPSSPGSPRLATLPRKRGRDKRPTTSPRVRRRSNAPAR